MSKITEYTLATRFDSNDVLLKDGSAGTKIIKASDAAKEFAGLVSPIQHRNVYRGKNLGTAITEAQQAAIHNATVDDLFEKLFQKNVVIQKHNLIITEAV